MQYRTLTVDEIYIHPGSAWFRNPPQYLLAGEIVYTSRMYARTVSPLKREWLNEISSSLASRIKGLQPDISQKPAANAPAKKAKKCNIYDMVFDLVDFGGKKDKQFAAIPYTCLPKLATLYKKANRHPKNIEAAILYKDAYIGVGSRLNDILRLNGRINFNEDSFVKSPCSTIFGVDNLEALVPYLNQLMQLSPMKHKNRLGFVELLINKTSAFFHVNASFTDALNNTAYSLLVISDERTDIKAFKQAYNRVIKLLD